MKEAKDEGGLDIVGFGKIANAIPPAVYEHTAATLLRTFEQLTAPITETTAGLGRYLRQKFDNMVEAEKAIATYTVQRALERASRRLGEQRWPLMPPSGSKSFVHSIEEASQETDPLLHEMWVNLISCQLTSDACHPHFVRTLPHFSPAEARLLLELTTKDKVGENGGGYFSIGDFTFEFWLPHADAEPRPWSISCTLLHDFAFINGLATKGDKHRNATILHRTGLGSAFIAAVSGRPEDIG